jgi:hypothetical protein
VQLLRTLAIIFLIFWVLPWVFKRIFPFLLKRFVEKKMGQFNQGAQSNFNQEEQANFREGEVRIKKGKSSSQSGTVIEDFEDIDFEEVKD